MKNRTLQNIIQTIEEFEELHEFNLHQDSLEISVPQAFYRYATVRPDWSGRSGANPERDWTSVEDSVDVRMIYRHSEFHFSIILAQRSHAENFQIAEHQVREEECVTEYLVPGRTSLTIRDAKRLVLFLQTFFRGFDFNLKTKASTQVYSNIVTHFDPSHPPSAENTATLA